MARTILFFIIGILILESRMCWDLGDPDTREAWKTALFLETVFDYQHPNGFYSLGEVIDEFDYLKTLKVDVFWLRCIFHLSNSNAVMNHTKVDERIGTLSDIRDFLDRAHKKGFKVILGVNLYDTSEDHVWFQKAIADVAPYNNFYVTLKKEPPRGSYNRWDDERHVGYLQILPTMPCLNVSNPEVDRQLKEIFEFWLNEGVDGFMIEGYQEYMEQYKRLEEDAQNILSINVDYLREIRYYIDEWTRKNNSTFKYLGFMTSPINITQVTWPMTTLLTTELVNLTESASTTAVVKNRIEEYFSMTSMNTSTNWLVLRSNKSKTEVTEEKILALNMLFMLLPGQACLMGGESPVYRRADIWSGSNVIHQVAVLRARPVFKHGDWQLKTLNNDGVLVLRREIRSDPDIYMVIFNFRNTKETVNLTTLFTDLEEQLDIVLTSDTNEKLRALKITHRDSVSVSPDAGTVLVSRHPSVERVRNGGEGREFGTALIYDTIFTYERSNGFWNFQDVIDNFSYFKTLNVDALALGSIFPLGDHNAVKNHMNVSDYLGSMADFERLLDGAHNNGIKVILKVTPYETSQDHPWFGQWYHNRQPYSDFYATLKDKALCKSVNRWNDKRKIGYLQILDTMPCLNVSNLEVRRRIKEEIFEFWLNKGVDGFIINGLDEYIRQYDRLDKEAKHLVENNIIFSREIRKFVDAWTIAHNSTFKYLGAMTPTIPNPWRVVYGEEDSPGAWPLIINSTSDIVSLAERGNNIIRLKELIEEQLNSVPSNASTNWMVSRGKTLQTKVKKEKLMVLNMLFMLLPGQVNLLSDGEPSDRRIDASSALDLTRQLSVLRKNPVFEHGAWQLGTLNSDGVFVLRREMRGNPTVYLVVLNFGDTEEKVNLTKLFTDLEEQLDIVLTSDTNEKLRALKVTRRDSVSVSPDTGTVLASRRKWRESDGDEMGKNNKRIETVENRGEGRQVENYSQRRENVPGEKHKGDNGVGQQGVGEREDGKTTERAENGASKEDNDDKRFGKGGVGRREGENSSESGGNEKAKNNKSVETVENRGEGRQIENHSQRGENVPREKHKGDNGVGQQGVGEREDGKTTERAENGASKEDNDHERFGKGGVGRREGENSSESGGNEKGKNNKTVETVENRGEGRQVENYSQRGENVPGEKQKGDNGVGQQGVGRREDGKTTERAENGAGKEDNDDERFGKGGVGRRRGEHSSESGGNEKAKNNKNVETVENRGEGRQVENHSQRGENVPDGKHKGDNGVGQQGVRGREDGKTTERAENGAGKEDNDDERFGKGGVGRRGAEHSSENGGNEKAKNNKSVETVENRGERRQIENHSQRGENVPRGKHKGDNGVGQQGVGEREDGKTTERAENGASKEDYDDERFGKGGVGRREGENSNESGGNEKGKNNKNVETVENRGKGRQVENHSQRGENVPGEKHKGDNGVGQQGVGGREDGKTTERAENGAGKEDNDDERFGKGGVGRRGGEHSSESGGNEKGKNNKSVETRGEGRQVENHSHRRENVPREKRKGDNGVGQQGVGGREYGKSTERAENGAGKEDNDDKRFGKGGVRRREGGNTIESGKGVATEDKEDRKVDEGLNEYDPKKEGKKVNTDDERGRKIEAMKWGIWKPIKQFWGHVTELYSTYRRKKLASASRLKTYWQKRWLLYI